MLMEIPQGELFLTNSSVEVLRLIRARWNDFSIEDQQKIVRRLSEGPPRNWFLEGADVDRIVDRTRFDVFSHMIADGRSAQRFGPRSSSRSAAGCWRVRLPKH
jgi:hypothetical protein